MSSSAPLKRTLFSKPAWSNPQQVGTTEDFFHKSKQTYVDLAAEVEQKRKARLAKKQREQNQSEAVTERAGKRRRISDASVYNSSDTDSSSENIETVTRTEKLVTDEQSVEAKLKDPSGSPSFDRSESSPTSLAKRYEDTVTAAVRPSQKPVSAIIDLETEDGDDEADTKEADNDIEVTAFKASNPQPEDDFPASDEEYPELARQARDKARRKRLEKEVASMVPESLPTFGDRDIQQQQSHHLSPEPLLPLPPLDPVVQILITSRIPNTEPLIVSRRISQRLKDVRITWCQRQAFPPDMIPTVFLTWRGKRLFDVTTCKSLGIAVDPDGNILLKGQKDIMGEEDRRIHMEAMTDEILEQYKRAKQRDVTRDDDSVAEETPASQRLEAQIRVILKARNFDDVKLVVKPVRFSAMPIFTCLLTYPVNINLKDGQRISFSQQGRSRTGGVSIVRW